MRVLITGASGLLGRTIKRFEQESDLEIIALSRDELNICCEEQIKKTLKNFHPDWLINCAAATDVDRCELENAWACQINAKGPRLLSEACKGYCGMLHVSTDFVFDGRKNSPYIESDKTNPLSVYGVTKRLGECSVLENDAVVVRTQWLYGREKRGFVDWILSDGGKKRVVNDCFGCPTNAEDLAACILDLIQSEANGIYHVANSGVCSRYDFAEAILFRAGKQRDIESAKLYSLQLPALRPRYSALTSERGIHMRSWQDALVAYFDI